MRTFNLFMSTCDCGHLCYNEGNARRVMNPRRITRTSECAYCGNYRGGCDCCDWRRKEDK
jgi:hypothetical protein